MPHLLVVISPHGYGHAAQLIPVLNLLRTQCADLRLTLRTTLAREWLAARIEGGFDYVPVAADFGMAMGSAIDVLPQESAARYVALHARWDEAVADEARALSALEPDLVLLNVPYLTAAGAARAGIPAIGLSSLNWADIFEAYCLGLEPRETMRRIHREMRAAYQSLATFIQVEPHMPMNWLARRSPVGPVARLGTDHRRALNARLGIDSTIRIVVIAPGGMDLRFPIEQWRRDPGLHYLVPESWNAAAPDITPFEPLGFGMPDLMCSVDALIGKPGYGTFAEVACNGTPMLYVPRGDWPEEPYLTEWIHRNARARAIPRSVLATGDIRQDLESLWALSAPPPPAPRGVADSAAILLAALGGTAP